MIRAAPNAQKSQLLTALESARCEAPDLCELRRLCLFGYRKHVAALNETSRAKELLSQGDRQGAARALDHADQGVTEAAAEIARCADAQGAAHRKYKF